MRALVIMIVTVALSWLAPDAAAQSTSDDKAKKAESKKLYEEATAAYKLGDFDTALDGYQAAYRAYAAPALLFNIAQCHLQLGDWDRAIFFFEGYLRDVPNATNRELVEDLIREAKEGQAKQDEADRERAAELAKQAAERKAAEEAALRAAAEKGDESPVPETPGPAPRPIYKKWWFWTAVGGVAAGTAVAVALASGGGSALPAGSLGTWDRR